MPRYFFHIEGPDGRQVDDEGGELPDLMAARQYAMGTARQILSQTVLTGGAPNGRRVIVTNEQGHAILEVPFKEAMGNP